MTRSRSSAKRAGAAFEYLIARHLNKVVDDRIEVRRQGGSNDRGDIGGVRVHGERVVIETKDYGGQLKPGPWLAEAQIEAGNDDAAIGVVVAKRRGTTDPGDQFVLMEVRDLVFLLTGERPETLPDIGLAKP